MKRRNERSFYSEKMRDDLAEMSYKKLVLPSPHYSCSYKRTISSRLKIHLSLKMMMERARLKAKKEELLNLESKFLRARVTRLCAHPGFRVTLYDVEKEFGEKAELILLDILAIQMFFGEKLDYWMLAGMEGMWKAGKLKLLDELGNPTPCLFGEPVLSK